MGNEKNRQNALRLGLGLVAMLNRIPTWTFSS
jgi:hypothetical protein